MRFTEIRIYCDCAVFWPVSSSSALIWSVLFSLHREKGQNSHSCHIQRKLAICFIKVQRPFSHVDGPAWYRLYTAWVNRGTVLGYKLTKVESPYLSSRLLRPSLQPQVHWSFWELLSPFRLRENRILSSAGLRLSIWFQVKISLFAGT